MDYKEKVIALLNSQELSKEQKEKLENIFPELKRESEDERIRKAIYNALKYLETELSWDFVDEVDILDIYAWLKKQGKKKPTEDVKILDADKVIEWLKNTIRQKAENYGIYKETHLVLPYNSIEDLINDFKEDFGL